MDSRKRKKDKVGESLSDWKKGRVQKSDRWEMESILGHRIIDEEALKRVQSTKRMVYVVVKWFGYGDDDCTIESVTSVPNPMAKKYFADQGLEMESSPDETEVWLVPMKESSPVEDDEAIGSDSGLETEVESGNSEVGSPL